MNEMLCSTHQYTLSKFSMSTEFHCSLPSDFLVLCIKSRIFSPCLATSASDDSIACVVALASDARISSYLLPRILRSKVQWVREISDPVSLSSSPSAKATWIVLFHPQTLHGSSGVTHAEESKHFSLSDAAYLGLGHGCVSRAVSLVPSKTSSI